MVQQQQQQQQNIADPAFSAASPAQLNASSCHINHQPAAALTISRKVMHDTNESIVPRHAALAVTVLIVVSSA
jgi:hypothetical protein